MTKFTEDQADAVDMAAGNAGVEATSYSGRAMFGQYCLGLSADNLSQVARFFVGLAQEDADLADALARNMRTDSLGLGMIAYFPSFDSAGFWADEDEDEDDEF